MDRSPQLPSLDIVRSERAAMRQHTLKAPINCVGIGVHSGQRVSLTLKPADIDHGIVFRRTDLNRSIPATYDRVVDTRLCTVIADADWASARVGTIEHLMAAFSAAGVDNALVELDGPEVPILDGSAAPFLFLLECAGIAEQAAPRRTIEIQRTVRVTDGDAFAEFRPLPGFSRTAAPILDMEISIDFAAPAIGRQTSALRLNTTNFRHGIARARTFALAEDVAKLQAAGLAQGGSLDNALVVDGHTVLNPGGLRMDNEFAAHKLLDVVGDLALAGAALHGRFVAHRPGHALNNKLLRALFAASGACGRVEAEAVAA